jgi:hypothetical protein
MKNNNKTPCSNCDCLTQSIRVSRANYKCEKCGKNKTLSDVFYYECCGKRELNYFFKVKEK